MSDWISVKDRMPDTGISVLVFAYDNQMWVAYWVPDWWSDYFDNEVHCVTHWQPLPEPPE